MVTIHRIDTIISDPNIRNGAPVVTGSRVRVLDVVASHLYRGLTPDALATNFRLSLGQVYAVLAYYYDNKATLDTQLREEAAQAERYLSGLEADGKLIRVE